MELKRYFIPLRRWWWLLAAATVIAALSSFLATLRQPPMYQSLTTLMIGRAIADPNPSTNEFVLTQQLAENYADIANREPMRRSTMEALGLTWLPGYNASATPNGQFVEIVVTDTIPQRAQAVANELAHQLILRSPTGAPSEEQSRQEFINKQLDTLEAQIDMTEADITKLQEDLGNMDSARQIADAQVQINALQAKLTDLQGNYADLLANSQSGAVNSLSVIEEAALPVRPIGPNKAIIIFLSAAIGLVLAAGAAYVLEYLDDTLKSPEEVEALTGAAIIGYIAEMGGESNNGLYVAENPRHPIVESYRTLRTNLEFAGVDKPLRTLFVASADTQDGKTSVAANLAVVMANAEKKVILMDADLRKPSIHTFLGISNDFGLSDVFRGRLTIDEALKDWGDGQMKVITAGTLPPNPSELLGSKKMTQVLAQLEEAADIVVIDGPPFIVTDAAVLSAKVDGVLLVVRSGYTHEPAVKAMMEQIHRANAYVIGVALNRVSRKEAGYYSGNKYYSGYYAHESAGSNEVKGSKTDGFRKSNLKVTQRSTKRVEPRPKQEA